MIVTSKLIQALIALGVIRNTQMTGMVATFAMNAAPTGWLKADGSAVSRTTYARLFALLGVVYGAGDGSTTFNLPDLRGEFVRGFDNGRGVDPARVMGSAQGQMFQSHEHTVATTYKGGGASPDGISYAGVTGAVLLAQYKNTLAIVGGTSGGETRPRNVALLACIKI